MFQLPCIYALFGVRMLAAALFMLITLVAFATANRCKQKAEDPENRNTHLQTVTCILQHAI
jgi:hypothetical protein